MRPAILISILFLFFPSCDKQKEGGAAELTTDKEKFSYAIGIDLASTLDEIESEIDPEFVAKGLIDKLMDRDSLLSYADAKLIKDKVLNKLHKQRKENENEKKRLIEQKYEKEISSGKEFLLKNISKKGIITTNSGLQYEILRKGKGAYPKKTDMVKVHYKGSFIDGRVFDSSYEKNFPLKIKVKDVIKGWAEGLQLMQTGSKYRFFIPYELGYGQSGSGDIIPPFSTLIFDVELLSINPK
jgi:FKBP-type peptidyl-prolyl cis-trans isomerase FklB